MYGAPSLARAFGAAAPFFHMRCVFFLTVCFGPLRSKERRCFWREEEEEGETDALHTRPTHQ